MATSLRTLLETVTGGERILARCELSRLPITVPVRGPLLVSTWEDGGGVKEDGITDEEGARSSFGSVLNESPPAAAIGEAGPSVEGKLCWEDGTASTSCGVVGPSGTARVVLATMVSPVMLNSCRVTTIYGK